MGEQRGVRAGQRPEHALRDPRLPAAVMFLHGDESMADDTAALSRHMPESQLAVLPGTSDFVPPGSGLLDRAGSLAMIPPFLDAPPR